MRVLAAPAVRARLRPCWRRAPLGLPRARAHAALATRPTLLLTSADGGADELVALAERIRSQTDADVIVLAPDAGNGAGVDVCAHTFDARLRLEQLRAPGAFALLGATPADCVLVGADPQAGLLAALGLPPPALVLVGIHRGPSLSGCMESHAAVAVARGAAQLGLPALAACLATPTPGARLTPAEDAVLQLLPRLLPCLRAAAAAAWPAPANFPRAHFPFPEAGRWALGRELPLPALAHADGAGALRGSDCWALGDDGAGVAAAGGRRGDARAAPNAHALLRRAFADGDLLLALNVPPTWRGDAPAPRFASVRPGVLWRCHQVEAPDAAGVSWAADAADLYGRSLPADGFGSPLTVGAFVSQDNTGAAVAARAGAQRWQRRGAGSDGALPSAFVLRRGTTLSDDTTSGDVDAVFEGRAALGAVQAWPPGHPFALRDELLAAALDEGADGLPQWLAAP